jgi:pyridoxine/pyridoxamine 5'-phosphate oxidase
MSEALQEAKSYIAEAGRYYAEYPDASKVAAMMSQAYAAIAQAAALERIASALESTITTYEGDSSFRTRSVSR